MFGGLNHDALWGGDDKDRMAGGVGEFWNETTDANSDLLVGGSGPDLLLGQAGQDGSTGSDFTAGVPWRPNETLKVNIPQLQGGDGIDHLHGGPDNDTLHGGAGSKADKACATGVPSSTCTANINNILFGADGVDLCSNGPLGKPNPNDFYAGTDRGDIRDPTCEEPAEGQSERAVPSGNRYVFVPYTINVPAAFSWDGF
jgi:Ca2+-binding RTX toxin-like protein